VSLDGRLPPNWPAGTPVPAGATPAGSGSLVGSAHGVMIGVYQSPDAPEKVYAYYTTEPSIHTTSKRAVGSGSVYVGRVKISAPITAGVTILPYSGGSLIVMAITGGA
jgi:hypothetical protein